MSTLRLTWLAGCICTGLVLGVWWGLSTHILVAITFGLVGAGLGAALAYNPGELITGAVRVLATILRHG